MKKYVAIAVCLMLLVSLGITTAASEPKVLMVSGAKYTPGSTLTVDIQAMTDMDARIYNAWLEGTVQYQWFSGSDPVPGATNVSYTISGSDKSVHVEVTCGDLVLTSTRYLVTSAGIVVTRKTTGTTTVAPTTKASTTNATTAKPTTIATTLPTAAPTTLPTTVPVTQDSGVMLVEEPTVAPATVDTAATTTVLTGSPTTQVSAQTQQESTPQSGSEEFPWWTIVLVGFVAAAIITAVLIATRRKK